MRTRIARKRTSLTVAILLVAGLGAAVPLSAPGAAAAVTPTCPIVASCSFVVTINPDGSASISGAGTSTDGEGDDVVIGVVNDSNGLVPSISLSGDQSFAFDEDGPFGGSDPGDYEGPNTSFSNISTNSGTVNFSSSLLPQGTSDFALEAAPASVTATITPGLIVSTPQIIGAVEGEPFGGQVTTFTDAGSMSPGTEFVATIYWGDGTKSSGTIGGSDGTYTVSGTHTYSEEMTSTTAYVSVDEPTLAVNKASSSDGTVTVADAPLTGASAVLPPATKGSPYPAPVRVATFTDANKSAPLSDFSATISWGDGSTSTVTSAVTTSGSISGSNGSYTVTGNHTYTTRTPEPSAVSVVIKDVGGSHVTVPDNSVLVADAVISCTAGTTCSGGLTSGSENVQTSTNSNGLGYLTLSADPYSLSCGDSFRHGPNEETEMIVSESGSVTATITFPAKNGTTGKGLEGLLFAICFQSSHTFTDASGHTTALGLLRLCNPLKADPGPCVNWILPEKGGIIEERLTYPAGDPLFG